MVVHGPLLALLMLELVRDRAPGRQVSELSFRLRRPVFAGELILAAGEPGSTGAALRIDTARHSGSATAQVELR